MLRILEMKPSGAYSWQHLTFVISLIVIFLGLAVFFAIKLRDKDDKTKNIPLIVAAISTDAIEIIKIIYHCVNTGDLSPLRTNLPLFLCSIQLITIPMVAFTRGRLKEISGDFVVCFGLLGCILGTVGAAQNYNAYPVLSMVNINSGLTHCISGFAGLYLMVSGMATMKVKNIVWCCVIMTVFCGLAIVANYTLDYNYMFLRSDDGTPYSIFYGWVNGNPVLYPMIVIFCFYLIIGLTYAGYAPVRRRRARKALLDSMNEEKNS